MQEQKQIVAHWYIVMACAIVGLLILLSGCANVKEWRKVTTIDHINLITTIELYYKEDTSFDLGTEGLGEYYLFKIEGF